jgi:hypothetical protein
MLSHCVTCEDVTDWNPKTSVTNYQYTLVTSHKNEDLITPRRKSEITYKNPVYKFMCCYYYYYYYYYYY